MEIYTFDKSLQERLVELTEILSSRGENVPASQIKSEWSYHVELVLEPVGWRALWKIPRLVCEDFQVHYPTIVVVEVEQVDFTELSALVKIIAVQDEIHLPDKYDVPLVELYPTHKQENTNVLDMVGTVNCIDQLRFFYNYLWMPWDIDDDDNTDWVSVHLETRIRLFFDMKRGTVSKDTSDVIRTLIREGREIQQRIARLEDTISEDEETQEEVDGGTACQLMKLHFRLQQIKTEMEVLENPAMREILVKNRTDSLNNQKLQRKESKERSTEGYFVWLGGTLEEMMKAISKTQASIPAELYFKISGSLQETLQVCDSGDIIAIGEGTHYIKSAGNLEEGGTIRGISNVERTVLSVKDIETAPSLLDFSGNEVLLEGITIDAGDLRAVVIIRAGTTRIVNCRIIALSESIVKLGVVVLPNAKLIIENSVLDGLGTAVVIYSNADVYMDNCNFKNCAEGVQVWHRPNFFFF
ncbi:protein nessun dorma-like [Lasioglossum baleicum]|uniref:protein nessun dorma-like n=1 Tax=Lasioglossum baleicum TaxID=434251 RepID=UPI003FCC8EC9